MKIVTVVGARPQFIKCAPVSSELRRQHQEVLIHTGQHYDDRMSDIFFRELSLPQPDYNLGIGSGSHGAQTGAMLASLEEVFQKEQPDAVLVYGDTNSTLAGALAASKLHIPVAHVEAGLRSFNRRMPEEINRVVTDHLSQLLFCPTETALRHLEHEGIREGVYHTGDVMYDAVLRYTPPAEEAQQLLRELDLAPEEYYLATIHRAENTDDPERLQGIFGALSELDRPVVLPLHPRTRHALSRYGYETGGALRVLDPLGYRPMLALQRHARLILTDSGGVQKEAFFARTPCITLRDETEWVETVDTGWNLLAGAGREAILEAALNHSWPTDEPPPLFGTGEASRSIVECLSRWNAA